MVRIILEIGGQELLPLTGQTVQPLIVLLVLKHVAIIGEDVGELHGQGLGLHQQVNALLVGTGRLVGVVHVGIHIAHGVVGQAHAVFVLTLHSIVEHGVHGFQALVVLSRETVGVHQQRPHLIVVAPRLVGSQEVERGGHLLVKGVVEFIVVEQHYLHRPAAAFALTVALLLTDCNQIVDAFQLVVLVVVIQTQPIQSLVSLYLSLPLQLGDGLPDLLGLIAIQAGRGEPQEQGYEQVSTPHRRTV